MSIREKKYMWLPALLLIYGAAMGFIFGPELIAAGRAWQLWLTLGADAAICVALVIFLRKRARIDTSEKNGR